MTDYSAYPSGPGGYPASSAGPRLAGWWRRVGATIIDGIITSAVASVVNIAVGNGTYSRSALILVVGLVYAVLMIGSQGRTVGMMAVGTRVVRDDGGTDVGYGKAFLRWLVGTLLGITVIGGILDVLWPLWDERNQTLHDKAVSTLVVMV